MSTPGPNSKTSALEPSLGPIPGRPAGLGNDVSLDTLTPDEIRARIQARERDLKYHVEALKHEATTVLDDVNVGGRPLMDIIRQRKPIALAAGAGSGALVGIVLGLRARAKKRPPQDEDHIEFVRARLAVALDEAAERVARGDTVDQAMQRSMKTVPAVFGDSKKPEPSLSSKQTLLDVALTTAIGFAVKTAMDLAVRRYTDSDETFEALADATD